MDIHEYQAKEILARFGVPVPRGGLAYSPEQAGYRAREIGARPAFVLMPARFQTDDGDYGRLVDIVQQAGGGIVRNAATERFREALAPLRLPTSAVPKVSLHGASASA